MACQAHRQLHGWFWGQSTLKVVVAVVFLMIGIVGIKFNDLFATKSFPLSPSIYDLEESQERYLSLVIFSPSLSLFLFLTASVLLAGTLLCRDY